VAAFSRFILLVINIKLLSFRNEKCLLILERGLLSTLELHKKTDGDAAAGVEGDVGGGQEAAEVEQNGGGRARTVSQVEVEGSTPKVKTTFCLVLVAKSFLLFYGLRSVRVTIMC
jgi:hypothetical protein